MAEKQTSDWTEVNTGIWKVEKPGDSIQGVLLSKETGKGTDKNSMLYFLETKESGPVGVWGSAILDERMKFIQVGELVKIEFVELTKNKKKQDLKIFKVYRHNSALTK